MGLLKVDNNIAIGAKCVVTEGVPGKIISCEGFFWHVCNTDYDLLIK